MNDTNKPQDPTAARPGSPSPLSAYRPKFAIYHPNARGTGGALKMELIPASGDSDGCIMMSLAKQKTIGNMRGPVHTFATFDWENLIRVKLDFSDICKMMQVFRGECETIEDGRGLYHSSRLHATRIVLRHVIEPVPGYSIEVYRTTPDKSEEDRAARILMTPWEALGVSLSFENSIGIICFGIPKVLPNDGPNRREPKELRDVCAG